MTRARIIPARRPRPMKRQSGKPKRLVLSRVPTFLLFVVEVPLVEVDFVKVVVLLVVEPKFPLLELPELAFWLVEVD